MRIDQPIIEDDINKELSELHFTEEEISYIRSKKIPSYIPKLYIASIIFYIVLFIILVFSWCIMLSNFTKYLAKLRTEGAEVLYYYSFLATNILPAIINFCLLPGCILYKILDLFSPKTNELLTIYSIVSLATNNPNKPKRKGILKISRFIMGRINRKARQNYQNVRAKFAFLNMSSCISVKRYISVFSTLTLILLPFDLINYTLITDKKIEKVPFGSLNKETVPFNAIKQVKTGCYYNAKKQDMHALSFNYELVLPSGNEINLFNTSLTIDIETKIERIKKIDKLLLEQNKNLEFVTISEPPSCTENIKQLYDHRKYLDLTKLLRLKNKKTS